MLNNELAIIVAYYLSRFNKDGLNNLGFNTDSEAFLRIGEILNVKKNYIKFRRDEFDPVHPWRKGWLRPMDKRIVNAIEALQDLTEEELREIVILILTNEAYRNSEEVRKITSLIGEEENNGNAKKYVLRGPTGKKAEEYFMSYFNKGNYPVQGKLVDTRDQGAGYDFRIETNNEEVFIEVKGLSEVSGGVLFTNKEWQIAKNKKYNFHLVIVSNIDDSPEVNIISNPAEKLNPKRNILKTIQINWAVSAKEIDNTLHTL